MESAKNPKTKRIEYIDAIRGLAIFLVVWGHAIQYFNGWVSFKSDPVIKFIYSFHMPLFFMISGFLFPSSLRQPAKEFFSKKSLQLLLPSIMWAVILEVVDQCIIKGGAVDILHVLDPRQWRIWFLRELFVSCTLVYIPFRFIKQRWVAAGICFSVALLVPQLEIQRSLLPAFLAGIFLRSHYSQITERARYFLPLIAVVFIGLLVFWNTEYTLYFTPFPSGLDFSDLSFNFHKFDCALHRIVIGIAGSMTVWLGIRRFYRNNCFFGLMAKTGTLTMGIYLLQTLILEIIIPSLINLSTLPQLSYLVITFFAAIAITALTAWLTQKINRSKYAGLLLLGAVPRDNSQTSREVNKTIKQG